MVIILQTLFQKESEMEQKILKPCGIDLCPECLKAMREDIGSMRVDLATDDLQKAIESYLQSVLHSVSFEDDKKIIWGTGAKGYLVFIPD